MDTLTSTASVNQKHLEVRKQNSTEVKNTNLE